MDTSIVPEFDNDDQPDDTVIPLESEDTDYGYDLFPNEGEPDWDDASAGISRAAIDILGVQARLIEHFDSRTTGSPAPINQIRTHVAQQYLANIDPDENHDPEVIETELLTLLSNVIKHENQRTKAASEKHAVPKTLDHVLISAVLHHLFRIAEITPGGLDTEDDSVGILGVYQSSGDHAGIYRRGDSGLLKRAAKRFNPGLAKKGYEEVEWEIRLHAPKVEENVDRDLIFLRDEIFNYRTGERIPFSPEIVRTAKLPHGLPQACPQVPQVLDSCGKVLWDFEAWHASTIPDEGTRTALWQVYGMSVRPLVDWQKMVALYNEKGSNGKGTILDMIEAITGSGNTEHVALDAYDSQFGASSLIGKRLNLVHEVPVNQFMKKVDKLKSIITNDPIQIDRKHRDPISYKPQLVNIVALNGALQFGDKTESMERRVMILPMDMHFADGQKNRDIKDFYVKRADVSEYILYKALVEMPKYWELTEPESAKAAMGVHRLETNKVAAFVHDFQHEFDRPFLPLTMLRDLYMVWLKKHHPSSKAISAPTFNKELQGLMDDDVWFIPTNDKGEPRKFGVRAWLSADEGVLDEFGGDREVDKWRFMPRYSPQGGGGHHSLGDNLPRQARGFMRREDFDAWEAAGSPTSENAIRALLMRDTTAQAVAAMAKTPAQSAPAPTSLAPRPIAPSGPKDGESMAETIERLTRENEAMRAAVLPKPYGSTSKTPDTHDKTKENTDD